MEYIEVEDAKLSIASLSEAIISDPHSAVNKDKEHDRSFSKLRQLHDFLTNDQPPVVLLAILSLVAGEFLEQRKSTLLYISMPEHV